MTIQQETPRLRIEGLTKIFTLHTQGGTRIPVFNDLDLQVRGGECVCLHGPSGSGKSTLLRSLYANYKPGAGRILVAHDGGTIDLVLAEAWQIVEVRRRTIGYVSQFLRVIPRVPTLDVVAAPARDVGISPEAAAAKARRLLARLNIPERLWSLAPATFSGGEQQRVNIARGFVYDYPILLLDEPTASLDAGNRRVVIELILEAKARGTAIVGILPEERRVSDELILTGARIVLRDEIVEGTVRIVGETIVEIDGGRSSVLGAVDLAGDILIPGLVDLHTDNLEKHLLPRPGVRWNALSATLAHDAQIVSAGVTTVLDSIGVGSTMRHPERNELLGPTLEGIRVARDRDLLRSDHLLHLRCEVTDEAVVTLFEPLAGDPLLKLMSVMEHTPGKRQSPDVQRYRLRQMKALAYSEAEIDTHIQRLIDASATFGPANRARLAEIGAANGIPIASHDDETVEHVAEAVSLGMTIAEFPTTDLAARAAAASGLKVLMGAPNVIRGGSHSGNVAAGDLARAGLLSILSSDYVPISLLQAAFTMTDEPIGFTLPAAIRTVSAHPAEAAGLNDRGTIAPAKRADMVRVRMIDDLPTVRSVWRQGRLVF